MKSRWRLLEGRKSILRSLSAYWTVQIVYRLTMIHYDVESEASARKQACPSFKAWYGMCYCMHVLGLEAFTNRWPTESTSSRDCCPATAPLQRLLDFHD